MRIVHVTRQYLPSVGGIQSAIQNLSREFISSGNEVQVVALYRQFADDQSLFTSEEVIEGIQVRRIPFWGPHQYPIATEVLNRVMGFDIIHLHSCDFFLDFLSITRSIHKTPIVLSSHGVFFHTAKMQNFKRLYFQIMTRLSLRGVASIICVSDHDYSLLKKIVPNEKLHLLPNGIDYQSLSELQEHERDPNLIICVGRMAPNKGYDRLLKSFSIVAKKYPPAN
jgi:alpha-1,3-mannosyltransferase